MTDNSNSRLETVRRYAFYAAVLLAIAVPVFMTGEMLLWVVTGWTGFLATHSVHDLVVFGLVWMGLVGLLAQFYRATDRVNAILAMPLIMVPAAAVGLAAGTELAMMGVVFGAVSLIALALHPAGRSLLSFDRAASPDRLLLGLYAIGALALVAFGGLELVKQFTVADEHAIIQHYGNLAIATFYVALFGGLAVFRGRDWRFAAWSAGFVALYLGASSVVFPGVESSLGTVGGLLVVGWALAFVGLVERDRGALIGAGPAVEDTEPRPG